MKLNKIKYTLIAGGALLFSSCGEFGDMNLDPNEPSTAPTSTLLTSAQASMSGTVGATLPTLYVQHLAETQYTEASRYGTRQFDFNGFYTGPLINLEEIIRLNTDEATADLASADGSNANQIAVARIMKAFYFQIMTDRWGALPYTDALKGREDFSPSYDMQEDIYAALVTELTEAVAQIDGGSGVSGDIIFSGDMSAWAAFANTLRANLALRMSDADPATAQAQFEDAVSDGLITSSVTFNHLADANYQNPWFGRFITRTDYAVSEALIDQLKAINDPRLPAFAEPALLSVTGDVLDADDYQGMPYGIQNAGDIENASVSFITSNQIYTQDAPQYIMSMAQVNFMLAEAAVKGWSVGGDAESFYNAGIQASLTQWGVMDIGSYVYGPNSPVEGASLAVLDYADYIAQADVAYSAATAMDQIATQKWIALYLSGYEAWAEWRRLDAPSLTPAPDFQNNSGAIPVRQGYPTSEFDLNRDNYEAAVSAQGEDGLDTNLWWDVN